MIVRIHLPQGAAEGRNQRRIAPLTFIAGELLRLAAVSCLMLALWRLTMDLGWTGAFVINDGFFSHWQVWLALTFTLSLLSFRLLRYSRGLEMIPAPVAVDAVQPSEPAAEESVLSQPSATR